MGLKFTKMHGLGNDFIVIDAVNQSVTLTPDEIKALSDRQQGVGFDQCLIVEPSTQDGIDFFYRIYNADGSEVGQCGNGARALARFIHHYGLSEKTSLTVATQTTKLQLTLNQDDTVTVNMGTPGFQEDVALEGHTLHCLTLGNPHAALIVEDLDNAQVPTLGPKIETHPHFNQGTNVGFIEILSPNEIKVRVHERGAGETQACGSGACAAAAFARKYHRASEHITVHLLGGKLRIDWQGDEAPLYMTGPASFVFEGELLDL